MREFTIDDKLDLMEEVLKAKFRRGHLKQWVCDGNGETEEEYIKRMLPIKDAIIKTHEGMK